MPNPSTQEKLASQLGRIYVAAVMPLMSGVGIVVKQMAHVQGYYAGITYSTATVVTPVASDWIITMMGHRGHR